MVSRETSRPPDGCLGRHPTRRFGWLQHLKVSTWAALIHPFFPAFMAPGAQIFLALVSGWVLCTARRMITGIESFSDLDGRHAHDAFHRFTRCPLRYDGWWKLLTVLLVETFVVQGIIEPDLDDPLFHRWGRKVWFRRLVVRCGSVPPDTDDLYLGLKPGGTDPGGIRRGAAMLSLWLSSVG